jgi:hypothetical protein
LIKIFGLLPCKQHNTLFKEKAHSVQRGMLVAISLAFLASIAGFTIFFLNLQQQGLKTRTERLYYLPYELFQEGRAKQAEARVPLRMSVREVESGIFEHTLEIQSSSGEIFAQMTELGLDLSAPSEWKLISADLTFYEAEKNQEAIKFATQVQKKQKKENSSILLSVVSSSPKADFNSKKGLLVIKAAGARELSIWSQKSAERPVSPILWTRMPNTEEKKGEANYASLDGWFRYNEVGVPDYSKAKLLAHMWGVGVDGARIIYGLSGGALLLWILGLGLILTPQILREAIPDYLANALGCSLLFGSICLIFAFIFPPFHGPDEVHHFSGYAETSGKGNLVSNSLEIANLGSFHRIHRKNTEKFTTIDVAIKNQAEWPPDTNNPYFAGRSPLGMAVWNGVKGFINAQDAGLAMLQLRVINGLFVALCLLLALAVTGSIFPTKNLAAWYCAPLLLIPCIAHYSTVVSNYPFLIGGYVIQMVVLGILWATIDSPIFNARQLAKTGALLGLGMSIALCSADNALATLPFWGVILPAFLTTRKFSEAYQTTGFKDARFLIGSMIGILILFCGAVGAFSLNNSFLPELTSTMLAQILPVHGNLFVAGMAFLVLFSVSICAASFACVTLGRIFYNMHWGIPWRAVGITALVLATILLIAIKVPGLPEIDLSRGGNTTIFGYAMTVATAFADGLLPGEVDVTISDTFWRRLGWLDTNLPVGLMEFLRSAVGLGICILIFKSLLNRSHRGPILFSAATLIGLFVCAASVGMLYRIALYNVNSRYILVAYLFAAIIAIEGYRRLASDGHALLCRISLAPACICILTIGIQCWSWRSILNRYFQ